MTVIPKILRLPIAVSTALAFSVSGVNAQTIRPETQLSRIAPVFIDHHTSPPVGGCPSGTFWDSFLGRCVRK